MTTRFLVLKPSGTKMPTLGLGTYTLNGDALKEALDCALFFGYRHIDTALSYRNEVEIGQVIKDRVQAGKLKRKDLFVTSKVPKVYLKPEAVLRSAEESLENLQLSRLDMLLMHHPWAMVNRGDGQLRPKKENGQLEFDTSVNLQDMWVAFESLVFTNKVSNIGLSNVTVSQIQRILLTAKIPPSNIQFECHAYFQQNKLRKFCDSKNIAMTAYAPLGAPAYLQKTREDAENMHLLSDPTVAEIAESKKKTPAQVLLNFLLQRNMVVLPKSSHFSRIKENLGCLDFMLHSEDLVKMSSLDKGVASRIFPFLDMRGHPEFSQFEEF